MKIVFIGSGNLGTRLAIEMKRKGMTIDQVYSRTDTNAKQLANILGCQWTTQTDEIVDDAELYIFSLKDAVLPDIIHRIKPNNGLWVHTAGSMPADVFERHVKRYGILYPLQTFSKNRDLDFKKIPFFVEANTEEDSKLLQKIAGSLSENVQSINSEKRQKIHLAAVFACNFTNHIYAIASRLLKEHGIQAETLLPLIDETAAKVHDMEPSKAQTGPAIRYDENIIGKHLSMLSGTDKEIYRLMSQSIHNESKHE